MNATTQKTATTPIVSALLSACSTMDLEGMSVMFELRTANALAATLLETGEVFNGPAVHAAVGQLAGSPHVHQMNTESDALAYRVEAAFVLGFAAGMRIGGAR
jgi:hypothetical protein